MAKKRPAASAQPAERKNIAPVEIAPMASMVMSYFMQVNQASIGKQKGGLNIKTAQDSLVFKIDDIISMVDTTDGFIVVTVKPYEPGKGHAQFVFNKKMIESMFIDFDSTIRYTSEREQKPPCDGCDTFYS